MNAREQWKCNICGTVWDDEGDASSCCDPCEMVYLCEECSRDYPQMADAEACCASKDDER